LRRRYEKVRGGLRRFKIISYSAINGSVVTGLRDNYYSDTSLTEFGKDLQEHRIILRSIAKSPTDGPADAVGTESNP